VAFDELRFPRLSRGYLGDFSTSSIITSIIYDYAKSSRSKYGGKNFQAIVFFGKITYNQSVIKCRVYDRREKKMSYNPGLDTEWGRFDLVFLRIRSNII
jgi:hypothetical protein